VQVRRTIDIEKTKGGMLDILNNFFIDKKALFILIILIAVFNIILSSRTPPTLANEEQTQHLMT